MHADRLPLMLLLAGLVFLSGTCASPELEPVEFYPEDMCSRCRMAISDKRFAGEIVSSVENVRKFDDLGCMFGELRERGGARVTGFVVDFDDRGWVNMKDAYYIRSEQVKSPMGSGLLAFRDQKAAESAQSRYAGRLVSYTELTSKGE